MKIRLGRLQFVWSDARPWYPFVYAGTMYGLDGKRLFWYVNIWRIQFWFWFRKETG